MNPDMEMVLQENGVKELHYHWTEETGIVYQRKILELSGWEHLRTVWFCENGSLIYRMFPEEYGLLDFFGEPSTADIEDRFRAIFQLLDDTRDAMMDAERWIWNLQAFTFDTDSKSLRGIYLPNRSFQSSITAFFQDFAMKLIQICLEKNWNNPELILFLHELYHQIQKAANDTDRIREWMQSKGSGAPEDAKDILPVMAQTIPTLYTVQKPKETLSGRLRRILALPFA